VKRLTVAGSSQLAEIGAYEEQHRARLEDVQGKRENGAYGRGNILAENDDSIAAQAELEAELQAERQRGDELEAELRPNPNPKPNPKPNPNPNGMNWRQSYGNLVRVCMGWRCGPSIAWIEGP